MMKNVRSISYTSMKIVHRIYGHHPSTYRKNTHVPDLVRNGQETAKYIPVYPLTYTHTYTTTNSFVYSMHRLHDVSIVNALFHISLLSL